MRSIVLCGLLVGCGAGPAVRGNGPFDWQVGEWVGERRSGGGGSVALLRVVVRSVLDGAVQTRELEARPEGGVYRGFAVQSFDREREVWTRRYVNAVRGSFAELDGELTAAGSVWRSVTRGRTRESRLVSERLGDDRWRRTMSVSTDGSTWRVLWTDELRRR